MDWFFKNSFPVFMVTQSALQTLVKLFLFISIHSDSHSTIHGRLLTKPLYIADSAINCIPVKPQLYNTHSSFYPSIFSPVTPSLALGCGIPQRPPCRRSWSPSSKSWVSSWAALPAGPAWHAT